MADYWRFFATKGCFRVFMADYRRFFATKRCFWLFVADYRLFFAGMGVVAVRSLCFRGLSVGSKKSESRSQLTLTPTFGDRMDLGK